MNIILSESEKYQTAGWFRRFIPCSEVKYNPCSRVSTNIHVREKNTILVLKYLVAISQWVITTPRWRHKACNLEGKIAGQVTESCNPREMLQAVWSAGRIFEIVDNVLRSLKS